MAGGLTLAAQIAASLIPPGGIGAFFLIRRARALYAAARADADDARQEAREAWAEATKFRRINVQLWTALDAWDRHGRRLDAQVVDHGGVPLPRPADLTPRVLDD
jgi:hypothetical protein